MDRSSKQLQELDSFAELQSCRRGFSSSPSLYASSIVVCLHISKGVKRFQAQRPRALQNLRALDSDTLDTPYSCTLTSPRLSGRSVIRVVADDLPRLRRLAADRAVDGLHERCSPLVTADLQDDE